MARNFFGSLFLRLGDFLYFAGTNFLRLGQIGFSCWQLFSAIFRKSRTKSLIIFSVLLSKCNNYIFSNNTTACIKQAYVTPVTGVLLVILIVLFLNVRDKLYS